MAKFSVEYKDGSPSKQVEAEDFIDARDTVVEEFNKANDSSEYTGGVMGPDEDDSARAALIFDPEFRIVAVAKLV